MSITLEQEDLMKGKPKDRGKTKTLDDLLEDEKRSVRQGLTKRTRPRNMFPFTPARPDRPNPFGLNLEREDCRILNGLQEHGLKSTGEFCRTIKISVKTFYERLRNPDLIKGIRLLALGSRVGAYPAAMEVIKQNLAKSPKWTELYLRVNGLWDEPERPMKKEEDLERPLLTEEQIRLMIEGTK